MWWPTSLKHFQCFRLWPPEVPPSVLLKVERRRWEVQRPRQFETDDAQRLCCNLWSWLNVKMASSLWELVRVCPGHGHRDSDQAAGHFAWGSAGWWWWWRWWWWIPWKDVAPLSQQHSWQPDRQQLDKTEDPTANKERQSLAGFTSVTVFFFL